MQRYVANPARGPDAKMGRDLTRGRQQGGVMDGSDDRLRLGRYRFQRVALQRNHTQCTCAKLMGRIQHRSQMAQVLFYRQTFSFTMVDDTQPA